MKNGLMKKMILCVLAVVLLALVLTACQLEDPVTEAQYILRDDQSNYYNKDHTTGQEAVDEFTDSITALRKYLDSADFVDSGYYMGVNFDFDVLDLQDNTVGNFALRVNAYLYTFPYEDDAGNPIYYYYENGKYIEESKGNAVDGSRKLISGLEIHNEAIKKSDISIEWYNGATNEVLIGMYFDGLNSNADDPGNIMYLNVQGYKRSFADFGDTVLYQQLIRLLVHLSVEGLLEAVGLQGDAGVGSINSTMAGIVGDSYKRVVNDDIVSLLFYSVNLDGINKNVTSLLDRLLGVFRNKWDPMTYKFLGFRFSTVAQAVIDTITADMQAIIDWDKTRTSRVLKDAVFDFRGGLTSYETQYTYTSHITFDYGWVYPEDLYLDTDHYKPFDYGNYEFDGLLYVPAWDAQFDAVIKTDMQEFDNSTNNVFIEFRDIANGELMIGIYYREERAWLDITGMSYMYGWIALEQLGFPKVYDEHIDLADVLFKFKRTINQTIVSIVDSILDPASGDKKSDLLDFLIDKKTTFSEKDPDDIFSKNTETLWVDIELIKKVLSETGNGEYTTRQIINVLDSLMPYTMDQIAIMLGIASAEIMLEKTYFTFTWNVDTQEFTIIMYTYVGLAETDPHTVLWQLDLTPIYFGEYVKITEVDFSLFLPLEQIYTYSGRLRGNFIFSSQETVDLSKLLSATIGESSGLNTPYTLATNAGLSFTLLYDQFVKDQYVDGRWKKAGRSAFYLKVFLTERETTVIIELMSDDVCFDNKVYTDLPARERELGYIWVNIECVTKNGTQVIPKMKIRENVFMASMSAYMHNETSIQDDVTSFSDNDVNLSLTSIITALCKDAYVIPASKQLEITSSNETLQSLFRVKGLIGNIKVDAEFRYKVDGLDSMRQYYYMYEVGFFDDITGNSPYDTALHSTLPTYFYEDYMDQYHPLDYDFLVYPDNVILDDGTIITAGTMYLYELGGKKTVSRQPISVGPSSFFASESEENQDIDEVKFALDDLIMDPNRFELTEAGEKIYAAENRLVYEIEHEYFYRTYYGKQRKISSDDWEKSDDGTVYIYWRAIREVLYYQGGTTYYYFDRNMALTSADGRRVYIEPVSIEKKVVKFKIDDFIIDRKKFTLDDDGNKIYSEDNRIVFERQGTLFYRTKDGDVITEHVVDPTYWEKVKEDPEDDDEIILIDWRGIKEIVYYYEGTTYFYNNRYVKLSVKGDTEIFIPTATNRNLLFEYDAASVEVTEACKTQYAPRTNGSFMGVVRRYFIQFESHTRGELGKVEELYYDSSSGYKRYYSDADRDYKLSIYNDDGVFLYDEDHPVSLYVMEPCLPLAESVRVNVNTGSAAYEPMEFAANFVIDWELASSDMRGYMVDLTDVIIAPGMMGECSFFVRIIVVNREINALEYVTVYETEDDAPTPDVPVVDEIDLDPYDYILAKYKYLSDSDNFNVGTQLDLQSMQEKYAEAADAFRVEYFSQQKFAFTIDFLWQQSYIFTRDVGTEYLNVEYNNYENGVLTKYAWYFDVCEKGNNRENAINPGGGTIYLHGYFKGQLVALKCNVGRRDFSHVRFYEPDEGESDFDPATFNENNLEGDPYIRGIYRANYYDQNTYEIGRVPTFVFTDAFGREYAYRFNIRYVAGLIFSGSNYNPYAVDEYLIRWGDREVTNVTASGSAYNEYEYEYVYSEETVPYDGLYETLSETLRNLRVCILKKTEGDKYVLDTAYLFERSGRETVTRTRLTYEALAAIVNAGDLQGVSTDTFVIEYGDGTAEKFTSDRQGYVRVRVTDTQGEYASMNRPFYYYTRVGDESPVYLTEKEFEAYYYEGTDEEKLAEKAAVRAQYVLHSQNEKQLTTAGLDLYYVMRLYFALQNPDKSFSTYAISVINDRFLSPEELGDNKVDATGFRVVELRIYVECPKLDLAEVTDRTGNPVSVYDDVRETYFGIHKVNAGDPTALGYYKVDPLNADSLYLPSSLDIYFRYEDFVSHNVFENLVWAIDFSEEGEPAFIYNGQEIIRKVTTNGVTRYKVALNVEDITGELTFRAMVRIGNEVSGYRTVSVAIVIQDKEPTNIVFYAGDDQLNTPRIGADVISGTTGVRTTNKVTYYMYFVNTFASFRLPDRLEATFGTGSSERTTTYRTNWIAARTDRGGTYVFTPDTVVTLVTTIGTTEGVTINVYLVVVVENYTPLQRDVLYPDRSGIVLGGEYAEYYVTVYNTLGDSYSVRNANGEMVPQKVKVKDLFIYDETTLSLRLDASNTYYVHISTGSADESGVPSGKIGLYSRNSAGRYELEDVVTLYEFLTGVYSKATLNLSKEETNLSSQRIINDGMSINRHKLRMSGNQEFPIEDMATLSYENGRFTLILEYRDGAMTYVPSVNEEGLLSIILDEENHVRAERTVSYAELAAYIINESLAVRYGEWKILSIDGGDNYPFGSGDGGYLGNYVSFNNVTKKVEYSYELGFGEDSVITLTSGGKNVTMTYEELTYRLAFYHTYLRVVDGTTGKIIGKGIAIGDLERIMDVNDMLVGYGAGPGEKYVVQLGTGAGAYDMVANLQFTGGYYLSPDYTQTQEVTIRIYSSDGDATYAEGFVMSNAVSAKVEAVRNDGSGQTVTVNYNLSQNDDKLRVWYVTDEENNPLNLPDIHAGDRIEIIPAQAIYATGKARQITMSTLTQEGFRITRTLRFENIADTMTSGYNGGNPTMSFAATETFSIVDGVIEIENVYDFVTPDENGTMSPARYLGTTNYLPTTVSVTINGRQVTVTDVQWSLAPSWATYLRTMTYTGTRGAAYVMATAQVLGCPITPGSQVGGRTGTVTLYANIVIHSAEIQILPWESAGGNGLATETLYKDALQTRKYYVVYVDAFNDADAVKSGVIRSEGDKRYVALPSNLLVQYTSGKNFTFSNVSFLYTAKSVTKIYFDRTGIDIATMTASSGELSGIQQRDLNERYIDLTVMLGLSQELTIRFYFHNKREQQTDCVVYYEFATDNAGNRIPYASLDEDDKTRLLSGTDRHAYIEGEDGYAKSASLLYYYTDYYTESGNRIPYNELTSAQVEETIEGTTIPLYVQGSAGYARIASLVYNDVTPVISLSDEKLREEIRDEIYDDVYAYAAELLAGVNLIRVNYNVQSVLSAAQAIRSEMKRYIEDCGITAAGGETKESISQKLLKWTTQIEARAASEYPVKQAFTDDQSYNFALSYLVETANLLAGYNAETGTYGEDTLAVWRIFDTSTSGTMSNVGKTRAINERLQEYYNHLVEDGFNAAIRALIEREYYQVLFVELSGMTASEYNDAVFYKNMIEAGFDADAAVAKVFKLRSLKKNNVSAAFAAKQLGIEDALRRGFGFRIEYETYGDGTTEYDALSDAQKAEKKAFGDVEVLRYGSAGGFVTEATAVYEYDRLAVAVLVQAIAKAYAYADAQCATKDEHFRAIRSIVIDLFEKRLNLGSRCAAEDAYIDCNTSTYTVEGFRVYTVSDDANLSKKLLAAYLNNLVREGMDFTAYATDDHAKWTTFRETLGAHLVQYMYNGIANYETTINSIRKSYADSAATVRNLINTGMKTYAETIYSEMLYAGTIKKVQELNGIVILPSRFTAGFDSDEFRALLEENLATYLIEPYYTVRSVPVKITMYFTSSYTVDGEIRTDIAEDVSGRPYTVEMAWTEDTVSGYVSYAGTKGSLSGRTVSPVTGETVNVNVAVVVRRKSVAENVITTQYIEDGLSLAGDNGTTSDGKYFMIRGSEIRYYAYDPTLENASEYDGRPVRYMLTYTVRSGKRTADVFSGYDEDSVIVYEFVNHYNEHGVLDNQSLYVYNPFEFSASRDLPKSIIVEGEMMNVKWNNDAFSINPRGNITMDTDGSQQVVSGRIANANGQAVSMSIFVAQWAYSGMYKKSTTDVGGSIFRVNGEDVRFTYMNPLNFYFSAYMKYSSEDAYLVSFGVRILRDGKVYRVNFVEDGDVTGVTLGTKEEGFVRKYFYPEDSRLLEYDTDDDTMSAVNARKRYVLYWEALQKTRVISGQLSQLTGCFVYLGNDDVGSFSLDNLKDSDGSTIPTKATYSCEKMSLSATQFMTEEDLTANVGDEKADAIRALYNDIVVALRGKDGQTPVVIAPDGYLPMTADVDLRENNVRYRKDELTVRLLWNRSYGDAIVALQLFVKAKYPDVEDTVVRTYANDLLMGWDKRSDAENREIVSLAMEYMREQNEQLGSSYTEEQCQRDAWDLLALNEKYNYSKEPNRLRGGGNNNVRVTILIGVEGSSAVYTGSVTVKMLFMDYSPYAYYELRDNVYGDVTNVLTESAYYVSLQNGVPFYRDLYIEVRKSYWTENAVAADGLDEYTLVQPADSNKKIFRFYDEEEEYAYYVEGTAAENGRWILPNKIATTRDELEIGKNGATIYTYEYDAPNDEWVLTVTTQCAYDRVRQAIKKAVTRNALNLLVFDWTVLGENPSDTVRTVRNGDDNSLILSSWRYYSDREEWVLLQEEALSGAGLGDEIRITVGTDDRMLVAVDSGDTITYRMKAVSYDYARDEWTVRYIESYYVDGRNIPSPYDEIGDDMRKLLEAYALSNAADASGNLRTETQSGYLVRVTEIVWKYDPDTHKLTSTSFRIGDTTYYSDLLQLNLAGE